MKNNKLLLLLMAVLVLFILLMLSSCKKEQTLKPMEPSKSAQPQKEQGVQEALDNTQKNKCTDPRPEMCTMEFSPVCSDRGKTYSNACSACADSKVSFYTDGECLVEIVEVEGADSAEAGVSAAGKEPQQEMPTQIPGAAGGGTGAEGGNIPSGQGSIKSSEECISINGKWKIVNSMGICDKKTKDAGKLCLRSTDCEGLCIANDPQASTGACSPWHVVEGCVYYLQDGKAAEKICGQ